MDIWQRVEESRSGEPGFYLSNDKEWGCNPCCEIGLRPFQFCNLVEINVSDVTTQEELNLRSRSASFIGTLQASYTDFHYLRPVWQRTTEKDALKYNELMLDVDITVEQLKTLVPGAKSVPQIMSDDIYIGGYKELTHYLEKQ